MLASQHCFPWWLLCVALGTPLHEDGWLTLLCGSRLLAFLAPALAGLIDFSFIYFFYF